MFGLGQALGLGPWEEELLPVVTISLQFLNVGSWPGRALDQAQSGLDWDGERVAQRQGGEVQGPEGLRILLCLMVLGQNPRFSWTPKFLVRRHRAGRSLWEKQGACA